MGQTADTSGSKIDISSSTWVDEANKTDVNDTEDLSVSGGAGAEKVALLSFQIADVETLGIPSNSILRKIHVVVYRKTSGPATCTPQLCLLNQGFTENQANWYGPEGGSAVIWEPAFDNASESSVNPGPLKGKPCDTFETDQPESATLVIDDNVVAEERFTFGSVVNCGLWFLSGGAGADFEDDSASSNQPQYYVTYEIPTPSSPSISLKPNSDGVTGTITIDKDTDSDDLQKYSICWHSTDTTPDHGDNVTDFTDTGKKTFDTSTLTGSALGTDNTSYYFRLYAEDSVNTDDNGGASNVIHVRRPEVANSSAISPTSLSIGEETTLTVASETIASAEYGGKFSSVLVNWDAGTSDTDADYSEYFFDQATAPATTTSGNLTITHKYSADTGGSANTIKVRVRDPNGFLSDKHSLATGATVAEADPICKVTVSKSKFLAAKYADYNTGLIVSAAQSKAIGSNRKIQNYLFTWSAAKSTTLVTVNAFNNNNNVFDDTSKRVAIRALTDLNVSSARLKVTGLASFASDGTPIIDTDSTFTNYKMVSETIEPPDAVMTQGGTAGTASGGAAYNSGNYTYNFFKTVESAVFTTTDSTDTEGVRYILTAATDDWTANATGATITEADSGSEKDLSVSEASIFRSGDVVRIDNEYMKVTASDTDNNRLQVTRQYLGTSGNSGASSSEAVYLANPIVINSDLRFGSAPTDADFHDRYRWGGFARILGEGATGIDFEPFADSTDTATNTIILQDIASASSSFNGLCWYENGFFDDDIIMVGNTSSNGSYATPTFYKLASFTTGGSSNYETAIVHGSDHDLPNWVDTTIVNEDNTAADIVRIISNPSRTVAAVNTANEEDVITFEARVIDNDGTSFIVRTDLDTTSSVLVQPEALDLNTVATYGTHLTTSDIAILRADMTRDGGLTTVMPLGERKYPVGLTRTTMGLPTMTTEIRVLSQTGYKSLLSLIEGDTYDYVFMDSTQVDTPTSAYVTFRMKYVSGNLRKSPDIANEYLATLNFVIVGEAVTV